jgi:hypothetical protein
MDHQQEAPAATSSTSASSSVECVRKNQSLGDSLFSLALVFGSIHVVDKELRI